METVIIIALIVTSIVCVTFIVERGLALREKRVIPQPISDAVMSYTSGRDLQVMRTICTQNASPLSRLLLFSTEHLDQPKEENIALLETRARHEITHLERGLVILEIIVGIAPLMGLVGTIYGLIILFGGIGQNAATQSAEFARGISTALNATLLGLLIAIPSLIAWSYYTRRVETYAVRMESLCDEFLRKHYRPEHGAPNGEPGAEPRSRSIAAAKSL
jgi:biopolymer transport protein ExbB